MSTQLAPRAIIREAFISSLSLILLFTFNIINHITLHSVTLLPFTKYIFKLNLLFCLSTKFSLEYLNKLDLPPLIIFVFTGHVFLII